MSLLTWIQVIERLLLYFWHRKHETWMLFIYLLGALNILGGKLFWGLFCFVGFFLLAGWDYTRAICLNSIQTTYGRILLLKHKCQKHVSQMRLHDRASPSGATTHGGVRNEKRN